MIRAIRGLSQDCSFLRYDLLAEKIQWGSHSAGSERDSLQVKFHSDSKPDWYMAPRFDLYRDKLMTIKEMLAPASLSYCIKSVYYIQYLCGLTFRCSKGVSASKSLARIKQVSEKM